MAFKYITGALISLLLSEGGRCFAQAQLPRRQAVEDIDYYVRAMRDSHYDPFRYISRGDYDARVSDIRQSVGDSISIRDFVWLCYRLTALLNDAHSTPQLGQPVFQAEYKKEQFFPYQLVCEGQRAYAPVLLAGGWGIPAGAEVTDINGVDMRSLLRSVQSGIPGIPAFREAASARLLPYFLFLKGVHAPFTLGYQPVNGPRGEVTVQAGVALKTALAATLPHIVRPYESSIVQNKLGYIDVRSLSGDLSAFRTFLDTAFLQFKKAGIRHLAIDLRQNSGGNTDLGDLLFSYISRKKYAWGRKSWKISETYKNYLLTGGDSTAAYLKRPSGSVWESGDCRPEESRFRRDEVFEGKVYFITGPFTFSSAMAVADVVKTYGLGEIVGMPVGENRQDFGEAFAITLPNSQIRIQSTSSFSHGADCKAGRNGPVQPDVTVRTGLRDAVQGRDAVLAYLLGRLR